MAGARKNAIALVIFLGSLAISFGSLESLVSHSPAGFLPEGANNLTSSRPLVPLNAVSGMMKATSDRYSSSTHHTKLFTAHSEGAIPTATGATEPKGSSKTAEQRMKADSATTAGILQSPSWSNLNSRQLLAASAASSATKAGPTPNNAEQMAQIGLQAEIAEALTGSGSPTRNAGDRH